MEGPPAQGRQEEHAAEQVRLAREQHRAPHQEPADHETAVDASAEHIPQLTYLDVVERDLKVMDMTAVTLCMDNDMPIVVFDLLAKGNFRSILEGEAIGTLVR